MTANAAGAGRWGINLEELHLFHQIHREVDWSTGKPQLVNKNSKEAMTEDRLAKEQEVILASKNDNGDWLELGKVELRSSFITDWLPAGAEKLHLALREEGTLKSICQFTYPATARRALVVLIADPQKKVYMADVVDPEKLKFAKESVLIVNFSSQPGMVVLGSKKLSVNPGQRAVAEPGLDVNGMYRMLVAYHNADKQPVPCYDRYVAGNPRSRNMLFLFPDPTLGLRVFRLPMFGDLD